MQKPGDQHQHLLFTINSSTQPFTTGCFSSPLPLILRHHGISIRHRATNIGTGDSNHIKRTDRHRTVLTRNTASLPQLPHSRTRRLLRQSPLPPSPTWLHHPIWRSIWNWQLWREYLWKTVRNRAALPTQVQSKRLTRYGCPRQTERIAILSHT